MPDAPPFTPCRPDQYELVSHDCARYPENAANTAGLQSDDNANAEACSSENRLWGKTGDLPVNRFTLWDETKCPVRRTRGCGAAVDLPAMARVSWVPANAG